MDNLKKSEVVIASILNRLMEVGLQHSTLSFEDLGLGQDHEAFFDTCVAWLIDEEIIRGNHSRLLAAPGSLVEPVITADGFALLGRKLFGAEDGRRTGEAVREIAAAPTSYSGIGDLIGGIFGGFTKSISS